MKEKKGFDELLADEEFQQGIFRFDAYDTLRQKEFLACYSLTNEQFIKARAIISGLSLKEKSFSDDELDYLFQHLNLSAAKVKFLSSGQFVNAYRWFSRIAAIVIIPLFIATVFFYLQRTELQSKADELSLLAEATNTVTAPAGGQTTAVLPDGSEVLLNAGSSIQYPVIGSTSFREVKLSGEGFFKVRKNPNKPMFVDVSGMRIKVYGTIFNVRSYPNDPIVETALVEGKISIIQHRRKDSAKSKEYYLEPGEVSTFNKAERKLIISKAENMDVFTGWVSDKYVFKNKAFKDVLARLGQLYNVEFVLKDSSLGDYYLDATFEDQSIEQIMEILAISLPIKWEKIISSQLSDNEFSKNKIIISKS